MPNYLVQKLYRNLTKLIEIDFETFLIIVCLVVFHPREKKFHGGSFSLEYCVWLNLFSIVQGSKHLTEPWILSG